MDFIKTNQDLLNKIAGSHTVVYRSEDYASIASGATQEIVFSRETSSILLHNRSAYDTNTDIYFYLDGISSIPVILAPGENISLGKAWANSVTIMPSVSDPIWQIVVTL